MAVFNLAINYPDAQGVRIMAALRTHYGAATNAAALEQLRLSVAASVRDIVLKVERDAAVTAASNGVTPVDPT